MTDPRIITGSSKARLWLKRRSVFAPRLVIRRQFSWPLRILLSLLGLSFFSVLMLGSYALGRGLILPVDHQIEGVGIKLERPVAMSSGTTESQISIERSARQQLARQLKTLESENGELKEDLAFFESLLPSTTTASGVTIRQLKADPVGPNQLRYRLLVMQGGKANQDFKGTVQLAVTVLQEGKNAMVVFPASTKPEPADAEKFQLAFKRYQRLEGVLTLPIGTRMQSMQARILENGRLRAQETMILKGTS
ncbi:MAG: DUF6776 family protein [Pseudomonadota bacterium]